MIPVDHVARRDVADAMDRTARQSRPAGCVPRHITRSSTSLTGGIIHGTMPRMARTRDPETLERMMKAGMHVFGTLGLGRARISDVADAMGVSHGTIYNYVESKEALFYLLVDWWLRDGPPPLDEASLPLPAPPVERLLHRLRDRVEELFALEELDRALERTDAPEDSAVEVLAIVEELYERTWRTRRAADMIERSAGDVPGLAGFFLHEVRRPLFSRMTTYLRKRADEGLLVCGDPVAGARLLVETVTYAARHRYRDPDPPDVSDDAFRQTTVELLCRAFTSGAAGPSSSGPRS